MANEDPQYLDWLRSQPCAVCGCSPCEPHHCGSRGMGQRSHDHEAVPLCWWHHRCYHMAWAEFRFGREARRAWVERTIRETWARYAGHELVDDIEVPF